MFRAIFSGYCKITIDGFNAVEKGASLIQILLGVDACPNAI
jgi:hypothetical protein